MKKQLLLFILLLLILSCRKVQQEEVQKADGDQKYQLRFIARTAASAATGGTAPSGGSKKASTIPPHLKYISYFCYRSYPWNLISYRVKDTSDPDMTSLNLNLPAGKYRFFAVASNKPIALDSNATFAYPPRLVYPDNETDLFVAQMDLILSGKIGEQELTLQRIVGQVKIVLTDRVQADARRIEVVLSKEVDVHTLDSTYGYEDTYKLVTLNREIKPEDVGKENLQIIFYALNGPQIKHWWLPVPLDIRIAAFFDDRKKTARKWIFNVANKPNRKTTLRGKLLEDNQDQTGFTVSYDSLFYGHNEETF